MIADKVLSSTSAQDSDSWEPIEFDSNTNESIEPANISSDVLPDHSSTKKLEELDTKLTRLEETLSQQKNNTVAQIEHLLNENFSLKSSAKKLEDLDTKITLLEEKLAQQNNNTTTQIQHLVNEVMSLKDIVSSQQKESHEHFKDLKDNAILDRSEIIHNVKDVKKEIQSLAEKNSDALEDLEDHEEPQDMYGSRGYEERGYEEPHEMYSYEEAKEIFGYLEAQDMFGY